MPNHYGRGITAALHQARREMDHGIGTTVHNWAQQARQAGIGAQVSAMAKARKPGRTRQAGIVAPDFPGNPRAPGGRRYRRRGPVDWTTKF